MKKIVIGVLILLLGVFIWYLFVKKYDYEITFKANMAPMGVYYQIKKGNTNIQDSQYSNLEQEVIFNHQKVILNWKLESVQDTVTKIKVGITSKEGSINNRLQILTGSSPLVELIKEDLINLRKKLLQHTNSFKVLIYGETELPQIEALVVSLTTKRSGKAAEMMVHNGYLYPKMIQAEVAVNGPPFVKIKQWNIEEDIIEMDFGFPVAYKDSLPINSAIKYDKIVAKKALKATYYGNYRSSDEAWFILLEYAKNNNLEVALEPLEIFYNDPMVDPNELQWKAEIFLPLK